VADHAAIDSKEFKPLPRDVGIRLWYYLQVYCLLLAELDCRFCLLHSYFAFL